MFEEYRATKKDFQAIEEGLKIVWRPEMDFVFKNKDLIGKVVVASYDSKFLYLWTKFKLPRLELLPCRLKDYRAYKIPHRVKLKDEWQLGWRASLSIREFEELLPKKLQKSNFEIPKISGGLWKPFIELQKEKKGVKFNHYTTYESFLATIVHEFGHVYYNQHKLWYYSNKKENLRYLKNALNLYLKKKVAKICLFLPVPLYFSETFAFCTEYYATDLFFHYHKKNLDKFATLQIANFIKEEEKKDLEKEDSVFDNEKSCHLAAAVFGKIILNRYSKNWPEKLLASPTI